MFQEIYIMKKMGVSGVCSRVMEVFETQAYMMVVMEYAPGGDLQGWVKQNGAMPEKEARNVVRQIVYGIAHIHSRSVAHRDIKLDNILISRDVSGFIKAKICDFGVSKIVKKGEMAFDLCGTPAYLAPEIVLNKPYSGFHVDLWSLGILLHGLLVGHLPFRAQTI